MATLFGGGDETSPFSPLSETQAVERQRRKMLGGSAMSAMLSGGEPPPRQQKHQVHGSYQPQSNQHQGSQFGHDHDHHHHHHHHHQQQQRDRRHDQQQAIGGNRATVNHHEVTRGIQMIKDKCEGRGQSLANFFVRNTEGDGALDYRDFQVLLRKLNVNLPAPLQDDIFRKLDVDGSGAISLYEFLNQTETRQRRAQKRAYAYSDGAYGQLGQQQQQSARPPVQASSDVSAQEIEWAEKALIRKIESKHRSMRKVFLAIDNDHNGMVSFDEFRTLLRQLNANLVRPLTL